MNILHDDELNNIVSVASELFLSNTISGTSIKDIAKKAGCGEASVYRHFKTKDNLAVLSATMISGDVLNKYFTVNKKSSGFARIKAFYSAYSRIFSENSNYYRFLQELDSLYLKESSQQSHSYEESVELFHKIFMEAYKEGLKDGTVRKIANPDLFYYSSAHSLLSLCKYLSVSTNPFDKDKLIKPDSEINKMVEIITNNLKKETKQ